MKIAILAGGTLGHIMPGLVLAKNLYKNHDVIYITSTKDKRFDVLNDAFYLKNVYYVDATGFSKNIIKNILTCKKVLSAGRKIKKILKEERIDLVIGMGGYISGIGILFAPKECKKIIHEQNKIMGLANKVVLEKVDKILLTFDIELKNKYQRKKIITSNPVLFDNGKDIKQKENKIVITSGSNGAREVNDIAIELLNSSNNLNYQVTLITGKKYFDDVKVKIKSKNVKVIPFTNDLKEELKNALFVISRAGSSTIFDAISTNTIPLLIPSKNVKNNHQYFNALDIKRMHMGEIAESSDEVLKAINRINRTYQEYIVNIKNYKRKYSLEELISIIERID